MHFDVFMKDIKNIKDYGFCYSLYNIEMRYILFYFFFFYFFLNEI